MKRTSWLSTVAVIAAIIVPLVGAVVAVTRTEARAQAAFDKAEKVEQLEPRVAELEAQARVYAALMERVETALEENTKTLTSVRIELAKQGRPAGR